MTSELALEFARKIRAREQAVGYWAVLDAPVATERIGRLGYDYVALDAQHGLLGYSGVLIGLMAIDAGHTAVGMVRVEDNNLTAIGNTTYDLPTLDDDSRAGNPDAPAWDS